MQIVDADAITPTRIARATAARIADATVHVYRGGHFDPYVQPLFTQVITDQLDFLLQRVPLNSPA